MDYEGDNTQERIKAEIEKRIREIDQLKGTLAILFPQSATELEGVQKEGRTLRILSGQPVVEQVEKILEGATQPLSRNELWEEYQARGYSCGGKEPRESFGSTLHNYEKRNESRLKRVGETPIKYILKEDTPAGPVLTHINPLQGPESGGQNVTLMGSGFQEGTTVLFGETASPKRTSLSMDSEGKDGILLDVLTPPGTGGVEVVVVNPDGQRAEPLPFLYDYI